MTTPETKAFTKSAGKKFAGIQLQPFTKQREVCACEMGLKFGFVPKYRPQYFLRDTILVLWLCTLPVSGADWTVDRCEVEPEDAAKEAYRWAEKVGIGIDTPAFAEGYKVFVEIMREVQQSRGEPIIPAGNHQEDNDSEL